jgi:hypothetical protein
MSIHLVQHRTTNYTHFCGYEKLSGSYYVAKYRSRIYTLVVREKDPDSAVEECDVKVKIADLGNAYWVNRYFTEYAPIGTDT